MQADAIRSEVILTLRRHFKVDLDVILFAHADLRLGSDPVIPDTLPTTKSPRVRVKIEALLKQGIQRAAVASANPDADKLGNPALAYNPSADKRSWKAMLDLFGETFGG